MKLLVILTILTLFQSEPKWQYDFETAKIEAKSRNKSIILSFAGSDWCGPCIKMTRDIFNQETFLAYAQNHLVLIRADFPRSKKNQLDPQQTKHNELLAEKYNPAGKFPLTLLLDANGKVLITWDGFKEGTPQAFIKEIEQKVGG